MFWRAKKTGKHKNIIGLENTGELTFSGRRDILIPVSKGILCALFVIGSLCGFASCFTNEFYIAIIFPVLFAASMIIAFVKALKSSFLKNSIYILFLAAFVFYIVKFYSYVNSGYHAIVNLVYASYENYLNISALVHYDEIIEDTGVTVTYFVIFCGIVGLLLMHMWISERIRFLDILLVNFVMFAVPLFVRLMPDTLYTAMLLTGDIALTILCSRTYVKCKYSGEKDKYSIKNYYGWFEKSGYNAYDKEGVFVQETPGFSYSQNGWGYLYTIFVSFIIAVLVLVLVNVFIPSNYFEKNAGTSELKEEVKDEVEYFVTFGLSGFFNRYTATGGLSEGRLGGIYSVRPDYETNLKVRYVPLGTATVYLRSYVGVGYTDRQWYSANQLSTNGMIDETAFAILTKDSALIDEYKYLDEATSYMKPSRMDVTNIDAGSNVFTPYYTNPDDAYYVDDTGAYTYAFSKNTAVSFNYYTGVGISSVNQNKSSLNNSDLLAAYLQVPDQTTEEILQFLNEENLCTQYIGSGDLIRGDELSSILSEVSQVLTDEFTYSLNPGITPSKKDFVGYFLNESRKGYCAHFASAATLILRTLGIPARYVEGYVITGDEIANGDVAEDADVSDYIDTSFVSLNGAAQVIDVEIADNRAHAWVEYYDPDFGWRVFEATTAAMDGTQLSESFLSSLYGLISRTNAADSEEGALDDTEFSNAKVYKLITRILMGCGVVLAFGIILFYVYRYSRQYRSYHRNRRNINVRNYYKIVAARIRRRHPEFDYILSVADQLEFIREHYHLNKRINDTTVNKLAVIIEHAAFAREEITYSEYKFAMATMKLMRKNILFNLENA